MSRSQSEKKNEVYGMCIIYNFTYIMRIRVYVSIVKCNFHSARILFINAIARIAALITRQYYTGADYERLKTLCGLLSSQPIRYNHGPTTGGKKKYERNGRRRKTNSGAGVLV